MSGDGHRGARLHKRKMITLSDWAARPLVSLQQRYTAEDTSAGLYTRLRLVHCRGPAEMSGSKQPLDEWLVQGSPRTARAQAATSISPFKIQAAAGEPIVKSVGARHRHHLVRQQQSGPSAPRACNYRASSEYWPRQIRLWQSNDTCSTWVKCRCMGQWGRCRATAHRIQDAGDWGARALKILPRSSFHFHFQRIPYGTSVRASLLQPLDRLPLRSVHSWCLYLHLLALVPVRYT